MKKLILLCAFTTLVAATFAQQISSLSVHNSCNTGARVCQNRGLETDPVATQSECSGLLQPQFFKLEMAAAGNFQLVTYNHTGTYTLYGPMAGFDLNACQQIALGQVAQVGGNLSGTSSIAHQQGYYILRVDFTTCASIGNFYKVRMEINAPQATCRDHKTGCKDCIGSFSPGPGKYLVSAWVKDDKSDHNVGYEHPAILVSYVGASDTSYLKPSGAVIDGWQRIDGLVNVPNGASQIKIGLHCEQGNCLFDDVRFIPIEGSMLSYVYDPVTLRLVAELDERNYATLYEYDEEGKLIRTKKETEKGIMTISEGRTNIRK
ncbi:hypothetical protein [Pedobacter xixiisoli]|nr:hypothetical protein [Pedobacter xixiisoli]